MKISPLTQALTAGFALALATARLAASAPAPESALIWSDPAEDGVVVYRIPQVLVTTSGTIIALAEARYGKADGSRADIVIRRSRDGGRTWTQSQFIEHSGPTENHVLPVLLQDRDTRRIFFFCALRESGGTRAPATKSYYRFSDDEGLTWSAPVDVGPILAAADERIQAQIRAGTAPAAFAGDAAALFGRKHFYFGPGRPIQLSEQHPRFPGRLVVPVFLIKDQTVSPRSRRGYGDAVLVSDDHGRTWQVGGPVPLGRFSSAEVSVAELDDGRLIINARGAPDSVGRPGLQIDSRILSYSSDGGMSWTRPAEDASGLPRYTETHSGLLRVPAPTGTGSLLLFSFPAGPGRSHGTVYVSEDNHRSWAFRRLIVPGTFGYSNLDQLPDGTIVLIYENASGKAVHLVRLSLAWLTAPEAGDRP